MADKNFKVKNGLEIGNRDIVTPDGTITLPEGTGTLAKTSDIPSSEVVISTQISSYTLQISDANKLIEMNISDANNLTIPLNSAVPFPIGTKIDIIQNGSGQTTIVPTSGVTINSEGSKKSINARYQAATLIKTNTDTWILIGALKA